MSRINEHAFEEYIAGELVAGGGYLRGNPDNFSRDLALDISILLKFIKDTQDVKWEELEEIHGGEVEEKFLKRLNQELDQRGMLDCLRNGVTDFGKKFDLAYFRPVSGLNPEANALYQKNILTVTTQVHYSKKNENSVDIILSVNGLPVATVELKNKYTGQDVKNAKWQYKRDRDETELLFQFKKRALVHFAMDADDVYMTTRIHGTKTKYLPFNKGNDRGAGNPVNPSGHKTSYMWEYIWTKDSWMDILKRYMHLQEEEIKVEDKIIIKETMIFPRYHQLDAVRKLSTDALKSGPGKNYLIQHSAGSGKSNSIAWLSYHLAGLHNTANNRIFDSVIVITDRKVLDRQLQNTIYQFEHKAGVVEKIDKNAKQLAGALTAGTNIIITTLQKFPFVIGEIGKLPKRNYAIIVDEAHSSQGGEAARKMKEVLTVIDTKEMKEKNTKDTEEYESEFDENNPLDVMQKEMLTRGKQKNLSFFGFTATPKARTLEVFGEKDTNGIPQPFHLYSMRQAIEEDFILDVLKNYLTYKTFYNLTKKIQEDPSLDKKKAARAVARFMTLHPHNLAQKTEVMIEHFKQNVMGKIGGKAKAMVVTSSREQVVRYKLEFDRYLKEKGYTDIRALIAFSGKVLLDSIPPEYTEENMNGFKEKELPEKFSKTNEYRLLLVAEKYQTGYDEPLLHTMYIDKRLEGVKAVQTISRLNRTCPGKENTFVLDFVNDRKTIFDSFQPYFEVTELAETVDPNLLYSLKVKIESYLITPQDEIDAFCNKFFSKDRDVHAITNAILDKAVRRYMDLEKDETRDEFKKDIQTFLRLYSFLSQIMPFSDIELEKLNAYLRLLDRKLPKRDVSEIYKLNDEVALEYYRLQKINEGDICLQVGIGGKIKGAKDAGARADNEDKIKLSEIIKLINERFGTDFTDADKLFFDQIEEEMIRDEKLTGQAKINTIENFKFGFEELFITKLVDRMDQNKGIFDRMMEDKEFSRVVKDYLLKRVYKRLKA